MHDIIDFLGTQGIEKQKKMLITQKNLKKYIKTFDNTKKLNYNTSV